MKQLQHNKISDTMFELSDIEIYELIKEGNIRKFPTDFWDGVDGKIRAGKVVKYLIENVLKWDFNTLFREYSKKTLPENNLRSILIKAFDNDELEAIKTAYPELRKMGDEILKTLKEKCTKEDHVLNKSEILELYPEEQITFFFKSFQKLFMTLKNDYTRQELIDILKYKKKLLGRNPTNLDMIVPQAIIYIREFDTYNWNHILQQAGL